MYNICYLLSFLFCINICSAQEKIIVVDNITISGSNHTKPKVIHRELGISIGDTILLKTLDEELQSAKLRLLGLGLFNNVKNNFVLRVKEFGTPKLVA